MNQGIITGCNEKYEWMLKTWWYYYSKTNTYPVTFMDFGMSKSARIWCQKRGQVISTHLPPNIPTSKKHIASHIQKRWELIYDDPWERRKGWFCKPFALSQSPYQQTYWIDIDTFIIKPLTSLFKLSLSQITLLKETTRLNNPAMYTFGKTLYATSVVGYLTNHPLIQKWGQKTCEWNHKYLRDQDILSQIIYEDKIPVTLLPPLFNAQPHPNIPPDTFIIHFANIAKKELYKKIYHPHQFS